jgi:hypothetical protein
MSVVYSSTVSYVGGRDGTIRSDDGMLDLKVAMPQSLGVASADGSFGFALSPIAMIASRTNRPLRERHLPLFQRGSTSQYP